MHRERIGKRDRGIKSFQKMLLHRPNNYEWCSVTSRFFEVIFRLVWACNVHARHSERFPVIYYSIMDIDTCVPEKIGNACSTDTKYAL